MEIPHKYKTIEDQLQFPFMRDVNLQCYMHEQKQYLTERYDLFMQSPARVSDVTFRDFVESAIWGGLAEQFQRARHRKYFSEDYLIVDKNN